MTCDAREHPNEETASEKYERLWAEGKCTDWTGYCSVPDYCTRPCIECGRMGRQCRENCGRPT